MNHILGYYVYSYKNQNHILSQYQYLLPYESAIAVDGTSHPIDLPQNIANEQFYSEYIWNRFTPSIQIKEMRYDCQ